jgi:hypothetical protein
VQSMRRCFVVDRQRALGGAEVRHLALVDGAIVAAGADGLATVDRGRIVPLTGAPRGFAQAIGAADGAVCTGGLDGLWTRARGAWHHAPRAGGPPSSDIPEDPRSRAPCIRAARETRQDVTAELAP